MFSFIIRLKASLLFFVFLIQAEIVFSQNYPENDELFSCTTITVGKNASADGSVITSHTCDSHRTRSWLDITAPKEHKDGAMQTMVKRTAFDSLAMPAYHHIAVGEIPEVPSTYGFINTANPFMPYDMNKLFRINGGWGWRGERTIARWYTMYATITQSRDWLPDEIGGVVWLALDNVATSIYIPLYCSITDVPESYKVPGRINGYKRESAWWAFNRLGTLTAQRWGDMSHDVRDVWDPIQIELFKSQLSFEQQALNIHRNNPELLKEYLTNYSIKHGKDVVKKAWELGDYLWTKYDEKF